MKVENDRGQLQLAPLRRGFQVLSILAQNSSGLSYGELKKESGGVSDASFSRLLAVLEEENLVSKDFGDGKYRVGEAFLKTAKASLRCASREELIQPVLESLARRCEHTVGYWEGVQESGGLVLKGRVSVVDSASIMELNEVNHRITRHPAGNVYLAFQDKKTQEQLIKGAAEEPVVSLESFRKRLALIQEMGYFVDPYETGKRLTRIAAAVFSGEGGSFVGVLTINAPGDSYSKKEIKAFIKIVTEEANVASRILKGSFEERGDL